MGECILLTRGSCVAATSKERLAKEQNAPSVEEERQKLRQASFNIAKKRVAIIKDVQVCAVVLYRSLERLKM